MGIAIVVFRLMAAIIFAFGAVWLAHEGKDGWGWCIVAALLLGMITYKNGEVDD